MEARVLVSWNQRYGLAIYEFRLSATPEQQSKEHYSLEEENSMKPDILTIHKVDKNDTQVELFSMNDWNIAWNGIIF